MNEKYTYTSTSASNKASRVFHTWDAILTWWGRKREGVRGEEKGQRGWERSEGGGGGWSYGGRRRKAEGDGVKEAEGGSEGGVGGG